MVDNNSFNEKYPSIAAELDNYQAIIKQMNLPTQETLNAISKALSNELHPYYENKKVLYAAVQRASLILNNYVEQNMRLSKATLEAFNRQVNVPDGIFHLLKQQNEVLTRFQDNYFKIVNQKILSIDTRSYYDSIIKSAKNISNISQSLSSLYNTDLFFQNTSLFLNTLSTTLEYTVDSSEEIVLTEETKEMVIQQIKTYLYENKDVYEEIKKEVSENNETLADTKKEIDWKYWIVSVIIPLLGIITTILSLLNPSGPTYNINIENNIQNNQNIENHIQNNVEFIQEISDEQLQEIIDILYEILNSEEQLPNQQEQSEIGNEYTEQ